MRNTFQLVDVDFGKDVTEDMDWLVEQQVDTLIMAHKELHETKLPKWRRIYKGRPAEEVRSSPWMNAANTVVQVVGETVDTMVARVMGLVWATRPLWPFQNYTKAQSEEEKLHNEDERRVLEDFMDLVGFEPDELNLHEVEALWYTEAANLGTSFVKINLEDQVEAVVVGMVSDSDRRIRGKETSIYTGPKVCNLRHEDLLADASVNSLERANFVAIRKTLKRFDLEERKFRGDYDQKVVDEILLEPDRAQPKETVRQELQDQGVASPSHPDTTAEWDIWECYYPYWHNNRKYRIIQTYHKKSKKTLRRVFNFLPDNMLPVKRAKLGYRTPGLYSMGYAEMLEIYQEEVSTTHNQRLDNATVANTRALRVSQKAHTLDSNMELFPAALLVGDKDDIDTLQVGDVYPSTFKNEEMTLSLVARRAGITPAVSGSGTGGMMKRPQVYSSQGTLAVMQENNSVVGFATSEFRHAHVILGSSLAKIYGKFGTFGKEEAFGLDGQRLTAALEKFEQSTLRIPIRASTGSLNREVEKQTGMLMAGLLQRLYTAVGQLIQANNNPMAPPDFKQYAVASIMAMTQFHKRILKDFDYDPDLYVPDPPGQGNPQANQPKAPGAGAQGGMAPGGSPMESLVNASQANSGIRVPGGVLAGGLGGVGGPQG